MDELYTAEQLLDLIDAHGSQPVAKAARQRYGMDGVLPLHAIKGDFGIVPVTMYRRVAPGRMAAKLDASPPSSPVERRTGERPTRVCEWRDAICPHQNECSATLCVSRRASATGSEKE